MKKIHEWFFRNLVWKLVSLIFAFILWFVCLNVNNPVDSKIFTLNLQLENQDLISNDFVLMNKDELENKSISVRVRTNNNTLTELSRQVNRNFRAYVDLEPVNLYQSIGEVQSVKVEIEIPLADTEYDITYQSLSKVDVVIDQYMSQEFNVEVNRLGEPTEGYIVGKTELDPATVEIYGAKTILDQIESVYVQVDLSSAVDNVSIESAVPIVYDKSGKDITSLVKLSTNSVFINVPVSQYSKINIDTPRITGNVADGYLVTNVSKSIDFVEIVGTREEIAKITSITLPAINVSNATENKVEVFDVRNYLGDANVEIRNQTPYEVTITVEIQKVEIREIQIPVERLQIIGMSSNFTLPPADIPLTIRGTEAAVSEAEEKGLYGTLDLAGLSPGTHEVVVQFSLPDNVSQIGESVITIEIENTVDVSGEGTDEVEDEGNTNDDVMSDGGEPE